MSKEQTSPVLKWILIAIAVVSLCAMGVFVLFMTSPAKENHVAKKLEARGFVILYKQQGYYMTWEYPYLVVGKGLNITEDDSRLICQLPHLQYLRFEHCNLSGLNLDDIGKCRDLIAFICDDVTPFPAGEIRKLAICADIDFVFKKCSLNDSDLEDFAKWTTADYLFLEDNTEITDAVFEPLEKIGTLRHLEVKGASVTKEGVEEFQKKRPDVEVVL